MVTTSSINHLFVPTLTLMANHSNGIRTIRIASEKIRSVPKTLDRNPFKSEARVKIMKPKQKEINLLINLQVVIYIYKLIANYILIKKILCPRQIPLAKIKSKVFRAY